MLHPDYQYSPNLIVSLAGMIAFGEYDVALASRILGVGALKGGMPLYKYIANRFLTFFQNILMKYKLSEYHTGYRAFSRTVLDSLPLEANTDDFAFDNQMLAQIIFFGYRMGEVSCPRGTSLKLPASALAAASNTVSAFSQLPSSSVCKNGASQISVSSATKATSFCRTITSW